MTSRIPDPESEFDDEGIPDPDESNPEVEATGDTGYGLIVPRDHAIAAEDFGTTADEEAAGEGLDQRLAREEADVLTDETVRLTPTGDDLDTPFHRPESVGRLVEDDEGAHEDEESETVAHELDADGGESAEESAMHIAPEEG
jgi:hypothetical protein